MLECYCLKRGDCMIRLVTIYFSGTGNTMYLAKRFSQLMECDCYSIEDDVDFGKIIKEADTICLCFPIHHSLLPKIFREFIESYFELFSNKNIISLCTQQMFSGDGAYSIKRSLPECNLLYAEHFNMPSNIGTLFIWSNLTKKEFERSRVKCDSKLQGVVSDIKKNKVKLRGKSKASCLLGEMQNGFDRNYEKYRGNIKVSDQCILCNQCVNACPEKTLVNVGYIDNTNKCTLCYRCVNLCPTQAITVIFHRKVYFQYDVRDSVKKLFL